MRANPHPARTVAADRHGSRELHRTATLLDWVELRNRLSVWPAGTVGSIVLVNGGKAVVEITDDRGESLDLVDAPLSSLQPLN